MENEKSNFCKCGGTPCDAIAAIVQQFNELMEDRSLFPEPVAHADFYCGVKYRGFIIPGFERRGIRCGEPLKALALDQQFGWLKERNI